MYVEQLKREAPDSVKHWQTEHARPDNPDYWQTLLKQISTLWWTPLDYGAEDFRKITEPTLVVIGDRDELIEIEQAVEIYRLIANAELAILPNASHMSAIGKLFTETVLDFFLRHSTTTSHRE